MISLPVAGAARFKWLSKLMYANQLLDLPFLAVTRNERQEYVIRHFFSSRGIIKAWRWWWAIQKRKGEKERERGGVTKNQKTTAQPTWWIMTAVKWITQEGEALQNIDLMLHSCREDVHPHYARSNIPQHTLGLWFPELLGEKEARTFLSDGHLSTIQCLQIKAWTESIKI